LRGGFPFQANLNVRAGNARIYCTGGQSWDSGTSVLRAKQASPPCVSQNRLLGDAPRIPQLFLTEPR